MPISQSTLKFLAELPNPELKDKLPTVRFVGLAYTPRIEWLRELQEELTNRGIVFEICSNKSDTSNESYWQLLRQSDILVTTTMQSRMPGYDWSWKPQVLFRFAEALTVGTALIATNVPGLERFFQAGVHFLAYESLEECADMIELLVNDEKVRLAISTAGRSRAEKLISARTFWVSVDAALGSDSLT